MSLRTEPRPCDSLWRATARHAAPRRAELHGAERTDVAIVGAGYSGLSTAFHLATTGTEVAVLEANAVGHGASGRNGGQVNPGLKLGQDALTRLFGEDGARLHALGAGAPDFIERFIREQALDCRFGRPGVLRLAHSPQALAAAERDADALAAEGVAARILDRTEAAELSGAEGYVGGLVDPRGGSLHPLEFSRELARIAETAGARIFERSRALRIEREGGKWRIACAAGEILAETLVLPTNGDTDGLYPGLACTLLPVNSFQIATEPLSEDLAAKILRGGHAAFDSRRLIVYFRKTDDRRIILGGRASFSSRHGENCGDGDYRVLRRLLASMYPRLDGVGIERKWTGLVCVTPDFLPHYHQPEPGLHIMLGFNGRGVAAATYAGRWLASRISGSEVPEIAIPETRVRPIPFHRFRAPALHLAMQASRLLDSLGR